MFSSACYTPSFCLDLDPAEVRRRNFIPPDAFPYDTPTGLTYDSGNYAEALDRALELSDYRSWQERTRQGKRPGDPLIGVGLATVVKGSGGRGAQLTDHARVIVEPSGRVTVHTGVSPHGQGTATTFSQLVADELGVTPSDVRVLHGDTDALPAGGGTAASRGLVAGGSAMYYPLQEVRQKLLLIAAHLLHCPAEDVVFQEGRVFNRNNPGQDIPFSRVAAAAHSEELLPPGVTPGLDVTGSHTVPLSPYSFGAHVAVVEVSQDTGSVKILKYVAVHDAGRIINPMLAEGQVQGAVAQGIGQALMEGMTYSPEGQPLTAALMDYALPHAQSLPDMTLETVETPSPLNPLVWGPKGLGNFPLSQRPWRWQTPLWTHFPELVYGTSIPPSPRKRYGMPFKGIPDTAPPSQTSPISRPGRSFPSCQQLSWFLIPCLERICPDYFSFNPAGETD